MKRFTNLGNPIMNSFDEKLTEELWDKYVGYESDEAIIDKKQFQELISRATGIAEQRIIDEYKVEKENGNGK